MTNFTEQNRERISGAIKKMIGFMNLECQVELREELSSDSRVSLVIAMHTPDNARFLIGKNGQNLKAFEHLVRSMFMKDNKDVSGIAIDVNDYKRSRASYIVGMAKQAVTRVRNTQKAEVLLPMSAYERRVVHMELAACPDIATESTGEEPNRKIVIKPYP